MNNVKSRKNIDSELELMVKYVRIKTIREGDHK